MDFLEYQQLFDDILELKILDKPYNDDHYLEYVHLNENRQNRWLKTGIINPELRHLILNLKQKLNFVVITEPWCGDASHTIPLMHLIEQIGPHIELKIQLRDEQSEIEKYLYNGTKSIPILIIRNQQGKDIAVWGPRPKACILLRDQWIEEQISATEIKIKIQQWYNQDKGASFQEELIEILTNIDKN